VQLSASLVALAGCLEFLAVLVEPGRRAHHMLLKSGHLESALEEAPIDVGYVEKRWHRLFMIALAMLPSFTASPHGGLNAVDVPDGVEEDGLGPYGRWIIFMLGSCSLAYAPPRPWGSGDRDSNARSRTRAPLSARSSPDPPAIDPAGLPSPCPGT
jgi:hypothetical protein